MRKWKPPFAENKSTEMYYDVIEDYPLIEASFAKQYGIRLRKELEMTWDEFCVLLSGIMPETPLGRIVSIRSEKNAKNIHNFTKEEKRIYSNWHNRRAKQRDIASYQHDLLQMEQLFQSMSKERGDDNGK